MKASSLNGLRRYWYRKRSRSPVLFSVEQFRMRSKRILPKMVFDFVDGGAESEATVNGNIASFTQWWLRPQVLKDVLKRDQSIDLLGQTLTTPLLLAPAGLAGLTWPNGEAAAAAAASKAGIPFVLSTAASCSIEEVRKAADGSLWLQLYLWRDREMTGNLVDRAISAGFDTLCLTVDVPLSGSRERDLKNGMTIPPRITIINSFNILSRPSWLAKMASAPVTFANFSDNQPGRTMALGAYVNSQLNPTANWDDLSWLRAKWPGKLVVKGVLNADDARRFVDEGVDAVIVSNHGGRQLDGAVPSLIALPEIVEAVGNRVPVLLDGGVRRGTDVLKAIALGASACLVGRPYLWGLAVGGEEGVDRVIEIIKNEIDRDMALLGTSSIAEIKGNYSQFLKSVR